MIKGIVYLQLLSYKTSVRNGLHTAKHCNHSLLEDSVEEKPELAILQKHILDTLLSDSYWATPKGYLIFWHIYQTTFKKQKPGIVETY